MIINNEDVKPFIKYYILIEKDKNSYITRIELNVVNKIYIMPEYTNLSLLIDGCVALIVSVKNNMDGKGSCLVL